MIAAISSSTIFAYDGTITFTGKIVDQTCTVSTGSDRISVTLPTVKTAVLDQANKTAAITPIVISLSGCNVNAAEGAKKVKAYFEPNASTDFDTGNLKNATGTGKAENVQIQLLNSDGVTPIKLGSDFARQNVTATEVKKDTVELRYNAQYYATAAVTPGDVSGTVNYTIAYE